MAVDAVQLEIRQATHEHARDLARRLRPAEIDELSASTGLDPLAALAQGVDKSVEAWSLLFDDQIVCMWGVVSSSASVLGARRGVAWLLTSDLVEHERYKKLFLWVCWQVLGDLLTRWDELVNAIDVRHVKALRWGRRLGFEFQEPRPLGVAGLDFCPFRITREGFACAHQQS